MDNLAQRVNIIIHNEAPIKERIFDVLNRFSEFNDETIRALEARLSELQLTPAEIHAWVNYSHMIF